MTEDLAEWVDPASPVNWQHPLNRERRLWLLGVPNSGWWGGVTWRSLVRGSRRAFDGALSGTVTWRRSGGHLGGSIHVRPAASATVDCGTPPGLNGATKASMACWIHKSASGDIATFGGATGPLSGGNRWVVQWHSDGTMYIVSEDTSPGGFGSLAGLSLGWHRVMVVFDGAGADNASRLKLYVDGVQRTLAFTSTIAATLGNVGPLVLGKGSATYFGTGTQAYNDFSFWSRTLSPAEAIQDWKACRLGYPAALRRLNAFTPTPGPNAWLQALSETLSLVEGRVIGAHKTVADNLPLTDARAAAVRKVLADVLSIGDTLAKAGGKSLSENLALSDLRTMGAHHSFADTLALLDALSTVLSEVLTGAIPLTLRERTQLLTLAARALELTLPELR
jgi:hypothetical protein